MSEGDVLRLLSTASLPLETRPWLLHAAAEEEQGMRRSTALGEAGPHLVHVIALASKELARLLARLAAASPPSWALAAALASKAVGQQALLFWLSNTTAGLSIFCSLLGKRLGRHQAAVCCLWVCSRRSVDALCLLAGPKVAHGYLIQALDLFMTPGHPCSLDPLLSAMSASQQLPLVQLLASLLEASEDHQPGPAATGGCQGGISALLRLCGRCACQQVPGQGQEAALPEQPAATAGRRAAAGEESGNRGSREPQRRLAGSTAAVLGSGPGGSAAY